jgi:hypothetical protein
MDASARGSGAGSSSTAIILSSREEAVPHVVSWYLVSHLSSPPLSSAQYKGTIKRPLPFLRVVLPRYDLFIFSSILFSAWNSSAFIDNSTFRAIFLF